MKLNSTKVFWLFIGGSVAMHAMLYVAWFYPNYTRQSSEKDYLISLTLRVFLKTEKLLSKSSDKPKNASYLPQKIEKITKLINDKVKQNIRNEIPQIVPMTSNDVQASVSVDTRNIKLHELLHSAINLNKHYPLSALRLKKQGVVRITFLLLNNGKISNLEINESSGFIALDKAAINAVKLIEPFEPANQYIASAKEFILDIKFQL